jgi:hypothetical protein
MGMLEGTWQTCPICGLTWRDTVLACPRCGASQLAVTYGSDGATTSAAEGEVPVGAVLGATAPLAAEPASPGLPPKPPAGLGGRIALLMVNSLVAVACATSIWLAHAAPRVHLPPAVPPRTAPTGGSTPDLVVPLVTVSMPAAATPTTSTAGRTGGGTGSGTQPRATPSPVPTATPAPTLTSTPATQD